MREERPESKHQSRLDERQARSCEDPLRSQVRGEVLFKHRPDIDVVAMSVPVNAVWTDSVLPTKAELNILPPMKK